MAIISGTTYYRLDAIDINGKVESSDIIALTRDNINGEITVIPNPTIDYININLP